MPISTGPQASGQDLRSYGSARRSLVTAIALAFAGATGALACTPRDYLAMELPRSDLPPELAALQAAYPDLAVDGTTITVGGHRFDAGRRRGVSAARMLEDGTILEQFAYDYPLDFDLDRRRTPFFDPGRVRNSAFFERLWFSDASEAQRSLRSVDLGALGKGAINVTTRRGVDCQLEGVIAALERAGPEKVRRFFASPGGGFNWRRISGTRRLSAHSFGIAVDLNAELGGYWRWTGASEGAVGSVRTEFPPDLVAAFERHGFIWGGKWHHYDGMHFEYRPELILHARMRADR